MQGPHKELIDQAGALLDRLAGYVVTQRKLMQARDLVRCGSYRCVGPHREASNVRRLAAACERACTLLDGTRCPSCGTVGRLDYIGMQEDENSMPTIALYNCRACGSTVSLDGAPCQ